MAYVYVVREGMPERYEVPPQARDNRPWWNKGSKYETIIPQRGVFYMYCGNCGAWDVIVKEKSLVPFVQIGFLLGIIWFGSIIASTERDPTIVLSTIQYICATVILRLMGGLICSLVALLIGLRWRLYLRFECQICGHQFGRGEKMHSRFTLEEVLLQSKLQIKRDELFFEDNPILFGRLPEPDHYIHYI